jgi:1-aminocyclopropane-1-carboxylate deaminase
MNTTVSKPARTAIGFSALKGGDFLEKEVNNFLGKKNTGVNWRIESNYHFGGYAKINEELVNFMRSFETEYNIQLDAVYTAKMFYGLFELIKTGSIKPYSVVVAVHSGGIQGNQGMKL